MDESSLLSSLHKENIMPNLSHVSETLKSSLPSSVKTKRAQWYSPCTNSPRPKVPLSPDDSLPILKLNHFEKTPRILFGSVKLGSSKVEELVVWNPHPVAQTLRVEKSPVKRGFTINCSDDDNSSLLTLEADEEVILPIKWEPIEAGRCRELIVFKWNEAHRLQAIVMGSAVDINTKKKRRSVLCNSQTLNTPKTKTTFKPRFSVVTKDPVSSQAEQHEFGKTIPDVKEISQEDERRETYVVTNVGTPQSEERRETYFVAKVPVQTSQSCHQAVDTSKNDKQAVEILRLDKIVSLEKIKHVESKDHRINNEQVESKCVKNVKSENDLEVNEEPLHKSADNKQCRREQKQVQRPKNVREENGVYLAKAENSQPASFEGFLVNDVNTQNIQRTESSYRNTTAGKEKYQVQIIECHENMSKEKHEVASCKETKTKKDKLTSARPFTQEKKRKQEKAPVNVVQPAVAFDVETTKKLKTHEDNKKKIVSQRNEKFRGKKTKTFKLKVAAKGVAPTKLKLLKPVKTSMPHHPMPFAAKNMYYDERWIEKQEEGFKRWLNFILTPPDECDLNDTNLGLLAMSSTKSQPKAPSKEDLSLKAYTTRRKMARLRRCACLLYQSEPVICVIRKIEAEVELGRLAIRPDIKIHADLGIKKNIVKMILSYNPLWLRIGLETVYGEILPVQSNSDVSGLARFITDHMLGNLNIARTYAHPKVPGLFKDGYVEQLCKFTLKKFLFLVLFLDRAKLTRIIDHDPCLFVKDAEFKSSRSILLSFSREYLKGEGDITKHLSYLGFSVTHQQRPVDEINYAVTNIAVDLRDGLRLTRVVELLTHNWKLTQSLRVPAISRLQKIHNVEVFMQALKEHDIPVGDGQGCGVNPRHIVDGHREKTLQLLWMIIFNFQVNVVLSEKQLKEEISFLEQNQSLQDQLSTEPCMLGLPRTKRESLENDIYFKSSRLSLLLKWCKLICRQYKMKVENFTVSFSDGRALCYLLHFYHPTLLPLSMIRQDTTLTRNPGIQEDSEEEEEGIVRDSWAASYSPGSGVNKEIEKLKANERENFKLIAEKVKVLGGVPMMTKFSDMSNTIPDEKVVITYTSYLCARLLDLRVETRAARKIQVAWKRYQLKKRLERQRGLIQAAVVIQAHLRGAIQRRRFIKLVTSTVTIQSVYRGYKVRQRQRQLTNAVCLIQGTFRATRRMRNERAEFIRYRKAVITLQAVFRGQMCRQLLVRSHSAVVIQSYWRRHVNKSRFLKMKNTVIMCQRLVRGKLQRERFIAVKFAAFVLQMHYRALGQQRKERERFLVLRNACVTVQAFYRGYRERIFVKRVRAAIVLQKNFKMFHQQALYNLQKQSAIKIQSLTRMFLARRNFRKTKQAAMTIQTHFRAFTAGQRQHMAYTRCKSSCIKLQSLWRRYSARKHFVQIRTSTIMIQASFRRSVARAKFIEMKMSSIKIQRCFRGYRLMKQVRNEFQSLKSAAIVIQSMYRQHKCRCSYVRSREAIIKAQAICRGNSQRRRYLMVKRAASVIAERYRALLQGREQRNVFHVQRGAIVTIQAAIRGFLVRRDLKRNTLAATYIQTQFRGFAARKAFKNLKASATVIQDRFRAYKIGKSERLKYEATRHGVIIVQAVYRGKKTRQHLQRLHSAATCLQANYRSHVTRARFIKLKKAAMIAQQHYRAIQLTRAAMEDFQMVRSAVLLIQSHYRGMVVRREVEQQRQAAIVIQTTFRRHFRRSRYLQLKCAACVIQTRLRAIQKGRFQAQRFKIMKSSAIKIQAIVRMSHARKNYMKLRAVILLQSTVRGMIVRRHLKEINSAAVRIQTAFRGYIAVKHYKNLQKATLRIQSNFRASKQLHKYQQLKSSAVKIQSYYRGHCTRQFVKQIKAAIALQSYYRRYTARKQYIKERNAIISIQASIRRFLAVRYYERLRRATIFMQRRHRANVALLRQYMLYHIQRGACIVLQSTVRRYIARRKFIAVRNAAVTLQRQYRAVMEARHTREKYLALKAATVTLQSFARGMIARRLVTQHRAARTIQSYYKMHVSQTAYNKLRRNVIAVQATFRMIQQRQRYKTLKKAALTIQTRYRAARLGRAVKNNFSQLKTATITVQKICRGHIARKHCHKIRSAIKIQAIFRAYTAHQKFLKCRSYVIHVQSLVRMVQARKNYQNLQQSAAIIQNWYRSMLMMREQRSEYILTRQSVIVLQSGVRRWMACARYSSLKTAAVCIQTRYRAKTAARKQQRCYLNLRQAAITIQAGFRAFKARQLCSQMRAARQIQAYFRMHKMRAEFIARRHATIVIQSFAKMAIQRNQFLRLKSAVFFCQRKRRATEQCRLQRETYLKFVKSVILIQSVYRGKSARKQVQKMLESKKKANEAAAKIQRFYRGYRAMVNTRLYYHYTRGAAITIQSWYRGFAARKLAHRIRCVVRLQAYYRGSVARHQYQNTRSSIIKIQATVRCFIERKRYLKLQQTVLLCQQVYRATKKMQVQRDFFYRYKSAVTRIQAVWRGRKDRSRCKQMVQSIVLVQALVRRYLARNSFLTLLQAAVTVQCRYRSKCLTRQLQNHYKMLQNAARTIQRYYRGHLDRKYVHQIMATRVIQRHYRAVCEGRRVRNDYLTTRTAIITIQAIYRGTLGRRLATRHASARVIQTRVRGFIARKQFQKMQEAQRQRLLRFVANAWYHLSVIKVQRAFRRAHALAVARKEICSVIHIQRWWRAVLVRRNFQDMRSAAIVIQNATRQRLNRKNQAATRIQAFTRAWFARKTVEKMDAAALKIQAWFRGHQVRNRVKSLKVKTARRRIKAANQAATESMKLCNRTRSALDYLLCCKNLTTIFDVLVNLEVVTRLSYVCCEQLVKDKALQIIFTVIRNSNRSLPHMQILKYAIAILINLAKCPSTYRSIYDEPDAMATLLELITVFREKEQIFSKTCCVLTILARRDDDILQDIRNTPKMMDKIKSVHTLTARKYNLEKRRSTVKEKMTLGTPYKNKPPNQTPLKSHTPYRPRTKSDWATWQDYVNKVQDPLQAIRSLLRTIDCE